MNEELQSIVQELQSRGINVPFPQEMPESSLEAPDSELALIQQELMQRGALSPEVPAESPLESWVNLPGRTLGSIAGGAAQGVNQLIGAPLAHLAGGALEGAGALAGKIAPQAGGKLESLAQGAYGIRDTLNKPYEEWASHEVIPVAQKVGEFATPLPPVAKAANLLSKTGLAKNLAHAVGAGTAVEGTKDIHILPEFKGRDDIENVLKSIIGVKGVSKAIEPSLIQSLGKTAQESLAQRPLHEKLIGRALSVGAKPPEDVLKMAAQEGVDLPFNLKLGSKWSDFFANNVFKSMFVSKAYKNVVDHAHKGMLDAFENNINKIHPEHVERDIASKQYKEALQKETAVVEKQKNKLYEQAENSLTGTEKIVPHHTFQEIEKLQGKFKIPSPSEPMKFVNKKIDDILGKWGTKAENVKIPENLSPEAYEQIQQHLKSSASSQSIPLQELVRQRQALLHDISYGENAQGARAFIKPLVAAIDKDIMLSSPKSFGDKWRTANAYYKNEFANRVKTDIARSLVEGQLPKEAMNSMGSPQEIRELQRILGNSPQSKEVMKGLKRAKFQQIIGDSVKNSDGSLSYANLARAFTKKSAQTPLLKELGGEAYEGMKKLASIAQDFTKSGKTMANPSGTAHVTSEFDKMGKVLDTLLKAGMGGAFFTGSFKTLGTAIGTPYVLSKIVANPKYVDYAVKYALAKQKNNIKGMAKIQKEMQDLFSKSLISIGVTEKQKPAANLEERKALSYLPLKK